MNREFLKGLGLEDDAVDSIMREHGKSINTTKQELDAVTTDRDGLKEQLADRDTQLEKLGEVDAEGLKAEIERLKGENATTATEMQEKLDKQAFEFKLENAIKDDKARNPKAVKALLDIDKIKLDGDKLLGYEEQMTALKESDPYQFNVEEEAPPNTPGFVLPGNPNGGDSAPSDPFAAKLAKYDN